MDSSRDFRPSAHLAKFLQLSCALRALLRNVIFKWRHPKRLTLTKTTCWILITGTGKPSWGWYLTRVEKQDHSMAPNLNMIYYNKEQGRGWINSFRKTSFGVYFHIVRHERKGSCWLLQEWDEDAAGDKVGLWAWAAVGPPGVTFLSPFFQQEGRWKWTSRDLENTELWLASWSIPSRFGACQGSEAG